MASMQGVFNGTLKFPPFEGQSDCVVPFDGVLDFTKKVEIEDEVASTGTRTIDLASLGPNGAKFVAVWYKDSKATTPAPINVTINGGAETEQLTKGGWKIHFNPVPAAAGGILSVAIAHTAEAEIAVWAFA